MSTKYCEYCRQYCESSNLKCPNCCAPLDNKVYPNENSIKETITAAINSSLKIANESINKSFSNSNQQNYDTIKPVNAVKKQEAGYAYECNKFITLFLIIFGGVLGLHKFYEGKPVMGVLYIFTMGFFFVGIVLDFIGTLFKPYKYLPQHRR